MIEAMKRSSAGFTLVELIVVIAILGILAGISVPVYSGYIAKAGEASDLQLLGAVNTAYSAACAELGLDPTGIVGLASLEGADGAKTIAAVSAVGAGVDAAALNGAFMRYYGGNAEKPFKVFTSLGYDRANGVFVDGAKEVSYTDPTTGRTVTVSIGDLTAYAASTFGQMDASVLTGTVDDLVNTVLNNASTSSWLYNEQNNPGFAAFLEELGLTDPTLEEKANALVLYAAKGSKDVNVADWYSQLTSGGMITLDAGASANEEIARAASLYAMMTAYTNSDYAKTSTTLTTETIPDEELSNWYDDEYGDSYPIFTYNGVDYIGYEAYADAKYGEGNYEIEYRDTDTVITGNYTFDPVSYFRENSATMTSVYDVASLYGTFNDDSGFQTYLQSQGQSDLNAYFSALKMIDENTSNVDLDNVLTNGFTDGGIADMVTGILGG